MKKYLYGVRDSSIARLSQRLILGGCNNDISSNVHGDFAMCSDAFGNVI
jgi:hypothetical protein